MSMLSSAIPNRMALGWLTPLADIWQVLRYISPDAVAFGSCALVESSGHSEVGPRTPGGLRRGTALPKAKSPSVYERLFYYSAGRANS